MTTIGPHSYEEFLEIVRDFHGSVAPGIIAGGFMIDLALKNLPEGEFFDAISETQSCLPDAIQLLTPCTVGNGWLRIINIGRYAITLFEKYTGAGVRVSLDLSRLEEWSEIKAWYMKLKPKHQQDKELLLDQFREAGSDIYKLEHVRVSPQLLGKQKKGEIVLCPFCGEPFRSDREGACAFCLGDEKYLVSDDDTPDIQKEIQALPPLKRVPVDEAVGCVLIHDMTRIIPGREKGPAFRRHHVVTSSDVAILKQMGKGHVFVDDGKISGEDWIHEDDVAPAFARAMAGEGVTFDERPAEGKITFRAVIAGLFTVDRLLLERFNMLPGVMCASRCSYATVQKGENLAATRAIPLYLAAEDFRRATTLLGDNPLFHVLPLQRARVGIIITGTEIAQGLVDDNFTSIITKKIESYDSKVIENVIVPDSRGAVCDGIKKLLDAGSNLIVATGGLSVDPDDVTMAGLLDAGLTDLLYGAPILSGAMTLLGRIGTVRVIGVPAGALFFRATSFDLLLPRLLANLEITRKDLARMAHGGYCLNCEVCTFPCCPFGK